MRTQRTRSNLCFLLRTTLLLTLGSCRPAGSAISSPASGVRTCQCCWLLPPPPGRGAWGPIARYHPTTTNLVPKHSLRHSCDPFPIPLLQPPTATGLRMCYTMPSRRSTHARHSTTSSVQTQPHPHLHALSHSETPTPPHLHLCWTDTPCEKSSGNEKVTSGEALVVPPHEMD